MPNHVHLLVTLLRPELAFSNFIKSIKTYSAKSINAYLGRRGRFWQREYYDHLVRNNAEHQRIVSYILQNPVKAGLCQNWSDWPYTYLA